MGGACTTHGNMRNSNKIIVGNLKLKDHLKNTTIDGRKICKCILRNFSVSLWTGFIWLRVGSQLWALVTTLMDF
jgi:hypothetical protein